LRELFNIDEVLVTSRRAESRQAFAREQSEALGLRVRACDSYEEVCRSADIIMTGTPSTEPFIRADWLKDGVFLGLMGLEEATHEVYALCDRLFVDYDPGVDKHASHIRRAIEAGAISPAKQIRQIWEVVAGRLPGRLDEREKVLVSTVGLTTQDTAIAHALYLQAQREGRGLRLPF
jgi:alanine dehydrogenase